ncbi:MULTISPECIES: AI-2E family transporter [unclassified Acinetobacter]|uniref:AI-2E family transporter n=1 Tax=unclassified Acinetobacter TaxID=196816 RepID=UPI00211EEAA7|nr:MULTISPECIES: AI-2E family transporter [unclassified Acinetobacter]
MNATKQMPPADLHKVIRITAGFIIGSLLIAALYLGKDIFIPLALAILLAFLVDPLVMKLRGWGLPQMPSIFIVVGLALAILSGAASYLGYQLGQLSQELPQYQGTIQKKMDSIRQFARGPSVWDGAKTTIDTVENSIDDVVPEEKNPQVQQVKVVGQQQTTAEAVMAWSERVLNPLATAGIVFLFVILILVNRKDLHDRFLKLLGGNLNIGTDALDEAANRIGKYLRMQLMVNVTYGIPMALGLWFIGVPAAIMWGMVAIVMRFVPYVGPMISAIFPIALAFAVDPTWNMVLWTVGLILLLELVSNNIIEPWLYGGSTGLSTLVIIIAAMFWTAVWGPIGLILSTPLTACLLVLSSYVPSLGLIKTLIGSTPALAPHERFYQRLVADDVQDAMDVAQTFIAEKLPKDAMDEIKARRVNAFYAKVAIPAIRIFSSGHNTEASAEHRLRLHQGLKLFNHSF